MKNTCRSLLFFKGVFNGRIDDQHIVNAFNSTTEKNGEKAASSSSSSSSSSPAAASSSSFIVKKHAIKQVVTEPTALSGSAFVFPYGSDCLGTISAGSAKDDVKVEGKFKRLLKVTAPSSSTSSANGLTFFHQGRLYKAPASIDGKTSNGNVQHVFAAPTVATVAGDESLGTMESIVRDANVFIAQQASAAIYDLAVTAARHATSVVEFDQYLCHSQTVQRHLSIIETSRYALDSLALSADADDSPFVSVFARIALENAVNSANTIFGSFVADNANVTTRRHPSDVANDSVVIDYTSLAKAKELLTTLNVSAGATDADIGMYGLGELFGKTSQKVKPPSMFSKNPLHLSPTHNHAAAFVTSLEDELATFPSAVLQNVSPKSKLQVKKAAEIASELLATVAVLHRFSAALSFDLENEGRSQSSLVPTFCLLSSARRAEELRTLMAFKNAGKSQVMSVDDASIHPSHL